MALAQPEPGIPDVFLEISDKGGCPALAQAIHELHELREKENFPTPDLAKVILKDPGLSMKVLRVVNSAFFRTRGDPITTITRAVVLLGIDTVVDLASGILLVEHFDGDDPALHETLMESLRAALLAQALAEKANLPNPEEAYLLGLFSNLGRLWLVAHYREDLARAVETQASEADSVDDAVKRHFGFSTDTLSAQILERWGLPQRYSDFFQRHEAQGVAAAIDDTLVLVAELSTETDDAEFVKQVQDRLHLSEERSRELMDRALESLTDQAEVLGIGLPPPRRPGRSRAPVEMPTEVAAPSSALSPVEISCVPSDLRKVDPAYGMQAAAEIARAIVDKDDLGPLLRDVLEGVARSGGFDAVVLYLADRVHGSLTARLSYGHGVSPHLRLLSVPVSADAGIAAKTFLDRLPHLVETATPSLLVPTGTTPPDVPAQSVVTYPLCVRDRAIGVLLAMRGGSPPIGQSALPVVQLFSQLAALAVQDRASSA